MRSLMLALVLVAAATGRARADGQLVEVEVGKSVELLVGYARGVVCDDLTILDADVHDKTPENNGFTVTGKAVGQTTCRVGTDPMRVHFLFDVHVIPAKEPPPKPKPAPEKPKKPPHAP